MRRRFQFSLRTLLVAMLVVAAFFAGMAVQQQLDKRLSVESRFTWRDGAPGRASEQETVILSDGSEFTRWTDDPPQWTANRTE